MILFLLSLTARPASAQLTPTPELQSYRGSSQTQPYQGAFADLANEIDVFWASTFQQDGIPYTSPNIVVVEQETATGCGVVRPEPNASYCGPDRTIYLVPEFLVEQAQEFGDYAPIAILSHEWGHHIQTLVSIEGPTRKEFELQADCLMGAFTRHADEQELLDYGDFLEVLNAAIDAGDQVFLPEDFPGAHGMGEREKISERTQRGRRARVASGKPLAGPRPPFGFLWADKRKTRLVHDPETASVVRLIFDMTLAGVPLRRISNQLAEKGIPSPSGAARWQPSSIREILLRPTYAGSLVALASTAAPVILPGVAEPIVSEEELAAVADRLVQNKAHSTRRNAHAERSLLRAGFIVCGHCGWALSVSNATLASRSLSPQYRCTAQRQHGPKCPRPSITASMVDGAVWLRVADVLSDPEIVASEVERRRDDGSLARELAALDKRVAALADKQSRVARRFAQIDDDDVAAILAAELKSITEEKTAAQHEREDVERRIADRADEDARVRSLADWCSRVGANLDLMSYDEKRLALDALGVKVRAFRRGTLDAAGRPNPRWELTMAPISPTSGILYSSSR